MLNTHDRRRDLGMLKSIGMTPGQVTVMTVTSMAVLGVLGSLLGSRWASPPTGWWCRGWRPGWTSRCPVP
ncbi:FtsX-like permease family protein [Streptomyces nogalater]